jgi:hypothetical protein
VIHSDLRPLGIGEILDRAVTLFVRRFAVLVLILALVAIPVAIVQYAVAPSTAGMAADLQRVLSLPPGHPEEQRAILRQIAHQNQVGVVGLALIALSAILSALSTTACMIGVAQSYAGRLPSVREVYREALRRWLPQLAAGIVFVALAFAITIALAIVVFFVALAIGGLAVVSRLAAEIVGIPIALVAVVGFFAAIVLLFFAAQMTLVSIALEDPNPVRGIAAGLRRTLSPAVFWRSLLVATIVFGVSLIGSLMLVALAAGVSSLAHVTALFPVIAVIGGVALNALLTSFIVIYAIDVRVRREGYDLVLAARDTPF